MTNYVPLTVEIEPYLLEKLRQIAEQKNLNQNTIVTMAIAEFCSVNGKNYSAEINSINMKVDSIKLDGKTRTNLIRISQKKIVI